MSSVSAPGRATKPKPPARQGTCRLVLEIAGQRYALRPARACKYLSKCWHLHKLIDGPPVVYTVCKHRGTAALSCSCPDHVFNKYQCKHLRSLIACGLISDRPARPATGVAR